MPPNELAAEIVRAYDIRGTVPDQIDESVTRRVGNAFAQWLTQRGVRSAVVGHDTRASSPTLYEAAIDGLRAAGLDVHTAGLAPTPVVGWTIDRIHAGGGLVVTASHNPPEFNGFKLIGAEAAPLLPGEIDAVAHLAKSGAPSPTTAHGERAEIDAITPYLELLAERFSHASGLQVSVDPGNGTTCLTGPPALQTAGATVHALHSIPRPDAPNHNADPQDPDTMRPLARAVRTLGLDCGIAWDGDGDRIGILDHLGRRYEADWLTALLARPLLDREPGAPILLDRKTSTSTAEYITNHGGQPRFERTGYSFVRRRMRAEQIAFAGETSGHIMFGPEYRPNQHYPWLDDGVYAACALTDFLARSDRSLAEHFAEFRARPISPELRLPCPDNRKAAIAQAIGDHFETRRHTQVDRSDGARITFPNGWAHARPSNTAPVLSLRFETDDEATYQRIAEQLREILSQHKEVKEIEQLIASPTIGPQRID